MANTTQFPNVLSTSHDMPIATDRFETFLASYISPTALLVPLASVLDGFGNTIAAPTIVTIGNEQIRIDSFTGTVGTVLSGDRGFNGSIVGEHFPNDVVRGQVSSWTPNQLAAEIIGLQAHIGRYGANIINVRKFYTPGTTSWTCPTGVTSIELMMAGAGGGGGGCYNSFNLGAGGGGGGAGEFRWARVDVIPTTVYTLIIGTGGTGGAVNGSGTNGGLSSFGANLTCAGGGGGGVGGSTTGGVGGASGSGAAGGAADADGAELRLSGGGGGGITTTGAGWRLGGGQNQVKSTTSNNWYYGGSGGSVPFGRPGFPSATTSLRVGGAGCGGVGGEGFNTTLGLNAGSVGGNGFIVIRY